MLFLQSAAKQLSGSHLDLFDREATPAPHGVPGNFFKLAVKALRINDADEGLALKQCRDIEPDDETCEIGQPGTVAGGGTGEPQLKVTAWTQPGL